jgi:hypothetical protein
VLTNPVRRHWKLPSNINETRPPSFDLKATQTTPISAPLLVAIVSLCSRIQSEDIGSPRIINETRPPSFALKATQTPPIGAPPLVAFVSLCSRIKSKDIGNKCDQGRCADGVGCLCCLQGEIWGLVSLIFLGGFR